MDNPPPPPATNRVKLRLALATLGFVQKHAFVHLVLIAASPSIYNIMLFGHKEGAQAPPLAAPPVIPNVREKKLRKFAPVISTNKWVMYMTYDHLLNYHVTTSGALQNIA